MSDSSRVIAVFGASAPYTVVSLSNKPDGDFGLDVQPIDEIPTSHAHLALTQPPHHLVPSRETQVDVVVSTKSGTGLAPRFWDVVLKPLLARLCPDSMVQAWTDKETETLARPGVFTVLKTENAESIRSFARKKLHSSPSDSNAASHTILLLSGDGGVVDILNETSEDSTSTTITTLALFPLGTANALFHSLHKPLYASPIGSPDAHVLALRSLLFGAARRLPVFETVFSPPGRVVRVLNTEVDAASAVDRLRGAIVASYGFHASIVYESDTPEYRKHGDKRFGIVAGQLLEENHQYAATVSVQYAGGAKRMLEGAFSRFTYLLASLVSNLERTFAISPASSPLDGVLRFVHFAGASSPQTMDIMLAAYDDGKHVEMPVVGYDTVDVVRITVHEEEERWRKVCVDGIIVEVPRGGTVTVQRSARETPLDVLIWRA